VKAALCGLLKEESGAPVRWKQLGELRLRLAALALTPAKTGVDEPLRE
jgi:hypothetical protein